MLTSLHIKYFFNTNIYIYIYISMFLLPQVKNIIINKI